jgi:hypothetical protein
MEIEVPGNWRLSSTNRTEWFQKILNSDSTQLEDKLDENEHE